MSMRERRRLAVVERVEEGQLTLAAAERLGLRYRQMRRVHRRFVEEGDAGVVHRLRGRPGNRGADAATRSSAVRLYREHYADFGCTLACEMLAERHGLVVDDQTLRRWLIEAKLYCRRRRSPVKRRRRVRKECFGQLVQIDGSHHDWFERRNPEVNQCVLMVMIDDATGFTLARFFPAETTMAAMWIFKQWSQDQRTVGRDHCVVLEGRVLQLKPGRAMVSLAGKRVTVQRDLQEVVRVLRGEEVIEHEALARRPQRQAAKVSLIEQVTRHAVPHKPAKNHPWQAPIVPTTSRRPRKEPPPVEAGSAPGSAPPRPPLHQPQPAA